MAFNSEGVLGRRTRRRPLASALLAAALGIGALLTGAGIPPAAAAASPLRAVAAAPTVVTGPEGRQSDAVCPAGTTVAGGGYNATRFAQANGGNIYDYVTANGPVAASNAWRARMLDTDTTVTAIALCAPDSQGYRMATGSPGNESIATCPYGTAVAGGGYGIQSFARANSGEIYDSLTANTPVPGANAWGARMLNPRSQVTAIAICAPAI
ncbi:hypothetical protein O1M63_43580 [Streptomyces mirabilis]|nr:hypothetical protein [Streptomyces mirabilis]